MAAFTDAFVSFGGYKTWYQTAGDMRSRAPLVLLHGGPGIPGNSYAQLMADLADWRPVVVRPAGMRAFRPAERPLALARRDLPR